MAKMLLVDDDELIVSQLAEIVQQYGELDFATSGQEAIDKCSLYTPDLILLDINLPDINGFSVQRALAGLNLSSSSIIFMTADDSNQHIINSINCGANYFLRKPIDGSVLAALIEKTLEAKVLSEKQQYKIKDNESKFKNIISMLSEAIVISDTNGKIEFINQYGLNLFGYKEEELLGHNVKKLTPPSIAKNHDEFVENYNKYRVAHLIGNPRELEAQTKQGKKLLIDFNLSEFRDSERRYYLAVIRDVTEKRDMREKIAQAALVDSLTGLKTRIALNLELDKLLHTELDDGFILAFMVDIDDFQTLNAVLGNVVCDELLKTIAREIEAIAGHDGFSSYRVSADRFVIFHFNRDEEYLNQFQETLIKQISNLFETLYKEASYSFSVTGVGYIASLAFQHGITLTEQLELAITSARKESGKGKIVKASQISYLIALQQASLKLQLANNVELNELDIALQPKINTKGQITSFEALLRWQKNNQYPDLFLPDFISAAEQSNAIVEIGDFVLEKVCQFIISLPTGSQIAVSINLSIRQLSQKNFVAKVINLCAEYGICRTHIVFELTESMIADDIELVKHQLLAIREAGFEIAIDDFGTGQSNLKYLHKLPISELKIDKSFIDDIKDPDKPCPLVNAVYAIAKSLELSVVAEGVETLEQVKYLQNLGVDEIQGFYFHKPMPANECKKLIESQTFDCV